jgi:DNA topoisomerase IB
MVDPSLGELVKEIGKDLGKPEFYKVVPAAAGYPLLKVHYSRVMRFDGIELPYYQKIAENMWGLSVIERMMDRLLAYDSATLGAAQLLYKAYLRVIGVSGFREALANGGKEEQSVIKQFKYMRQMQMNEGITLLDKEDSFEVHQYNFAGVGELLDKFGEQISGACEIPLVRLFGQSPAGLSSTGESDLRNYYDSINKRQNNQMRPGLKKLFDIISRSSLGKELPEDFEFQFTPLWQMSDKEKADIATVDCTTVQNAFGSGMIGKATAVKELRQQSRISGRFTNITDEDIKAAEEEDKNPPPSPDELEDNPDEQDIKEKENKEDIEEKQDEDLNENPAEFNTESIKRQEENAKSSPAQKEEKDLVAAKMKEGKEFGNVGDRISFKDIKVKWLSAKKLIHDKFFGDGDSLIFIRLSTKKEDNSPTEKNNAWYSFPDKEGYKKVYMPYGEKGKGFYYSKITKDDDTKDAGNFEESEHPREGSGSNAGQFTSKGGGGSSSSKYSEEETKVANSTSRNLGAVGEKAIAPKYVASIAKPEDKILDFGAGKDAAHAKALKEKGLDITAYEFGNNSKEGLHDPKALEKKYNIVYASNVLNVQSSEQMLRNTLEEIKGSLEDKGTVVFNYPESPRKSNLLASDVSKVITDIFGNSPEKVGGTTSAPLWKVSSKEESKSKEVKRTKSTQSFSETKRDENNKLVLANGEALPKHLQGKAIAPAWKDILINPDKNADLWAVGHNDNGDVIGWIYSDKHNEQKIKAEDKMIQELNKKFIKIQEQLEKSSNKGNEEEKENSFITKLLIHTGIRIGSKKEALGKVKTYGASTLESRHVIPQEDGTIKLDFIGKEGVRNIYNITDKELITKLLALKKGKNDEDALFVNTKYDDYLKYVKQLDGGKYTPKDFRKKVGSDLAVETIKKMEAPKNIKDYKKKAKEVSIIVAKQLNNTPGMAFKTYIVPSVWKEWKQLVNA